MPPIPSDFTDMLCSRKPRTRLNFEESTACVNKSVKLPMETADATPIHKMTRYQNRAPVSNCENNREHLQGAGSPVSCIISAFEELSTDAYVETTGPRAQILPTVTGKHSELHTISSQTMSAILDGHYDNQLTKVTIIDCRYPFEYDGGHIKGAINLYTKELVQQFLNQSVSSSNENHVLIFHCEFSSKRGPNMYRYLRSLDRDLNKDNYPCLNFTEIYLLEGGYKEFFQSHKNYTPMLHKEHKNELRHFRIKSKSWSAGDRSCETSLNSAAVCLRF